MGAVDLLVGEKEYVLRLPIQVEKNYAEDVMNSLPMDADEITVIFDFKKTLKVDIGFYSIFHQLRQKLRKQNWTLISRNVNNSLKSQFHADGMYKIFNVEVQDEQKVKQKLSIDVEFISPFIDSTVEILSIQANTAAKAGKPRLKEAGQRSEFDIVGVITLISNVFEGSIALCFKSEVFLKICSNMLDENIEELNDEVEDAAGELLNIIFGMAKAKLNDEKGYQIEKAIPTIIRGPGIRVKQTLGPTIILPFESDAGEFQVEIELSNSEEN